MDAKQVLNASALARTFLARATALLMRTDLGVGEGDSPKLAGLVLAGDTYANIEAISGPATNTIKFANNLGADGSFIVYDGARWKPWNGRAALKQLGAAVTGITNSETIVLQTLLPVNAWKPNDFLRFWYQITKSGATDSLTLGLRIGTAGTTSDTSIFSLATLATVSRAGNNVFDIKLAAATSALRPGNASMVIGNSNSAEAAPVTITSAAANALYVSLTIKSGGTTDTVGISAGEIELITP